MKENDDMLPDILWDACILPPFHPRLFTCSFCTTDRWKQIFPCLLKLKSSRVSTSRYCVELAHSNPDERWPLRNWVGRRIRSRLTSGGRVPAGGRQRCPIVCPGRLHSAINCVNLRARACVLNVRPTGLDIRKSDIEFVLRNSNIFRSFFLPVCGYFHFKPVFVCIFTVHADENWL